MLIRCSIDFHLCTVAEYSSVWLGLFQTHHLLYYHIGKDPTQGIITHHLLRHIFEKIAVRTCRGYLPEFSAGICLGCSPKNFAVTICREFFVFVSKSFFVYVSKSCLYKSKHFLYFFAQTFLFVRFSLLTVFLFVSFVAVMSHRTHTEELFHAIFCLAYLRICLGNLPREFAVAICRRNVPWLFAASICRGYLL